MATLTTPDEGMRQDFQAGLGLAQGFMGNYWKAKENQVEQERYRAGQALRDVQLSLYQTNLETVRNAATLQAQQKAAVPGLFGVLSKAQVNQWNPDSKLEFLEYIKANPALASTPEAKQGFALFDESEKVDRMREELEIRLENARTIAEIRSGSDPSLTGEIQIREVTDENGNKKNVFWTGTSWQPVSRNQIDPKARAVPVILEDGSKLPGAYLLDGKLVRSPENVYSVFGGGGQAAPASPAVAPTDGKATAVLKFDKSGNQIK